MKAWRGIIIGIIAVGLGGALISAAIGYFLVGTDTGAKTPSHAEIESFARIRMPPSARDIDATSVRAIDRRMKLRFTMDRSDLDAFVRGARFSPPLKRGYEPYASNELGWHLDRIRNTLGGDESEPGYGRLLVIDLDRPKVATVYLIASTS